MSWLLLVALAAGYGWAVARSAGDWRWTRTLAWIAGLATIGVALGPWVDPAADARLSAHMVQHALLSLVAAPALVAGAPVRLALRTLPRADGRRLARALHAWPVRALGHPLGGLAAFVLVLTVVHVPAVYVFALEHPAAHAIEHAALFWSAVALWAPLIAADPVPARPGPLAGFVVLVLAMSAMGAVGATIAASERVLYLPYATGSADPLADQALAGGLMWMGGSIVVIPVMLALVWRALAAEERRQQVRDRRAAALTGGTR